MTFLILWAIFAIVAYLIIRPTRNPPPAENVAPVPKLAVISKRNEA